MPFTLFPDKSGGTSAEVPTVYGNPIPIEDPYELLEICEKLDLSTDWFRLANKITKVAGCEPSTAYLLVQKKYLDGCLARENNNVAITALNRARYNHRITLMDEVRLNRKLTYFNSDGWVFHSAQAVTGSSQESDIESVYLVKFVDKRFLFAKRPHKTTLTPDGLSVKLRGYNVVSDSRTIAAEIEYDPSDLDKFPYDLGTVVVTDDSNPDDIVGHPYGWEELLTILWDQSTLGFSYQSFPTGGTYPDQTPIDIRMNDKGPWEIFCDLLHASGNDIFPNIDGTFFIKSIDYDYQGLTVDLEPELPYLIEAGYPNPEWRRIPALIGMRFLNRNRDSSVDDESGNNAQEYWDLPNPFRSSGLVVWPSDNEILLDEEDVTELGATTALGVITEEGYGTPGSIETVLTMAQTAVWKSAPEDGLPSNYSNTPPWLKYFANFVLTKYLRSRIIKPVDNTYGFFLSRTPTNKYQKVEWYISPNGPCTRLVTEETNVGVSTVSSLVGGGGGSTSTVSIKRVLIENDIYLDPDDEDAPARGVNEDDPASTWTVENWILTEQQFEDDIDVIFQDPASDDLDANHVDDLPIWGFESIKVRLKYYHTPTKTVLLSGVVADGTSTTITLEAGKFLQDDWLNGATLAVSHTDGGVVTETQTITDSDGDADAPTVTVGTAFDTTPDNSGDFTYEIYQIEPGYDADKTKWTLVTETIDDTDRIIVRHALMDVIYDDGEPFLCGEYDRVDFTDYPENESFPPDGTGTYAVPAENFLKKRYRGYVINGILIVSLCKPLPPPALVLAT